MSALDAARNERRDDQVRRRNCPRLSRQEQGRDRAHGAPLWRDWLRDRRMATGQPCSSSATIAMSGS